MYRPGKLTTVLVAPALAAVVMGAVPATGVAAPVSGGKTKAECGGHQHGMTFVFTNCVNHGQRVKVDIRFPPRPAQEACVGVGQRHKWHGIAAGHKITSC